MGARTRSVLAGVAMVVIGASCHEATAPEPGLTGTFVLTVVDGEALPQNRPLSVLSGHIELSASGKAERHIVYLHRQTAVQDELVARGSYRLEGEGLRFDLHEDGTAATAKWTPFAELNGNQLILRYDAGVVHVAEVYVRFD